jgi:hypothetical protein
MVIFEEKHPPISAILSLTIFIDYPYHAPLLN